MTTLSRTLVLPVALVAVLSACSTGTDPDAAAPAPAPSAAEPAASTAPTAAPTAAPSPTPTGTVIEVAFAGGEITGVGPRVEVPVGETVVFRMTSDVVEEVHIHGYDLYVDLPAGGTGEVEFTADIPGSFELELHGSGQPITQLRVA